MSGLNPQWEAGQAAGFAEGFDKGYDDGFCDGLGVRLQEARAALALWDAAGNEGLEAEERH